MRVAASCGSSSRKSRRKSAVLTPDSCLFLLAEEEPGKVWAMSLCGIVARGMRATITNKEVEVMDIRGFWGVTVETRESRRREIIGFVILVGEYVMNIELVI